jgi:hypothetical protein
MKINCKVSYNLDVLCFLNALSSNDYYVSRHKEAYDCFYPLLSDDIKVKIEGMVKWNKSPMFSPTFTLLISAVPSFSDLCIYDLLGTHAEIKDGMDKTPYKFEDSEYSEIFTYFSDTVIPLIHELEDNGFKDYWNTVRLPIIRNKISELEAYFAQNNLEVHIREFKDIESDEMDVYICSFANPHGIKLCGNTLLSDAAYSKETILANITHEVFHPPYDYNEVTDYVDLLAKKDFVIKAFQEQDPLSGYSDMAGFIEEHIVEALGTYIVYAIGVEKEPYEYFRKHDGGSHVLSPLFFKYILEHKRKPEQSMNDYFINFVRTADL